MKSDETSAAVVSADEIIAFIDRIVAGFKPRRIVLFGSFANGSPTEDSARLRGDRSDCARRS
jgi:hypothetical protein